MNKKRLIIIILSVALVSGICFYLFFGRRVIMCRERVESCYLSKKIGANIICPMCCNVYGEEIFDGTRFDECI